LKLKPSFIATVQKVVQQIWPVGTHGACVIYVLNFLFLSAFSNGTFFITTVQLKTGIFVKAQMIVSIIASIRYVPWALVSAYSDKITDHIERLCLKFSNVE
jgi:hypothetical protein